MLGFGVFRIALLMGRRQLALGKFGVRPTRWWREMDSSFRYPVATVIGGQPFWEKALVARIRERIFESRIRELQKLGPDPLCLAREARGYGRFKIADRRVNRCPHDRRVARSSRLCLSARSGSPSSLTGAVDVTNLRMVTRKAPQHVLEHTRNVVVIVIAGQAAAERNRAGREHRTTCRRLEIDDLGADQLLWPLAV
jgi:hypothetical protein